MLYRKKMTLPLFSLGISLAMLGALSLFPNPSHAGIAGFTTNLDLKLSGTAFCDDGLSSGVLDPVFSGKGKTTGTSTVIFGTGVDAGEIMGTMTIDWGSPGPGFITYTFAGDSLAQKSTKGFFQLDADSGFGSDLLLTGKYSLSKDESQVKKASGVWQAEIDENGFDCFGSGKVKAEIP